MKKRLLATILCVTTAMLTALLQMPIFAEENVNYEYVLPMEFVNVKRIPNGYKTYGGSNGCALYNLKGEKISDDYDYINSFYNNDVASAEKGGKYYVINSFGEVLSEYDKRVLDVSDYVLVNLTDENEDGRPLSYCEGEFGVYNYWGELLAVLPYDKYMPAKNSGMYLSFESGRLMYEENNKWGAIDTSFNTVIEPLYDKIYPFYAKQDGVTIAIKDGKSGLIDTNGRELTDFAYDYINFLTDDYGNIGGYKCGQFYDEKITVFDKHGNLLFKDIEEYVPYKYFEEYDFMEVYIENTRSDKEDNPFLYGIVDRYGNVVIPIENTMIYTTSGDVIPVKKSDGHSGYYDISGNAITEFNYTNVSPFSGGLGSPTTSDKNFVIDKNGNTVFESDYWIYGGFHGGIARNKTGEIINNKGEVVIKNDKWKEISWLNWYDSNDDGCFKVSDGELCGVVRYKGYVSPWAESEVEKAFEIGILDENVNYDYIKNITREGFGELIFNYCDVISDVPTAAYTENAFVDTDNEHIVYLNAMGIIKGKSETEFAPNDLLTREEAATIISRLINTFYANVDVTELYFEFADSIEVSDWAMNHIQRICNMGIMNGVGDNRFAPQENFTTEQAAATLVRCCDKLEQLKVNETIGGGDAETDIVVSDNLLCMYDKDGNIIIDGSDILSCNVSENDSVPGEWYLELKFSAISK